MNTNKFEIGETVIPNDFALGPHQPIGAQLACVGEKHKIQDFHFDKHLHIYMYAIHASDGFNYYWPESSLTKCMPEPKKEKPISDKERSLRDALTEECKKIDNRHKLEEFTKAAMQGLCSADGDRVIPKGIAVFAVEIARETIKELEKQNS